ncbi:MAG: dihydroxyacetone kinase family protein [Burkholderiaceae bacterium]|nr:dihydroxyacetone kinase family protein [Microbacteriaceae bacterium]
MTRIFDDPNDFADDALDGFVAANRRHVSRVDGGVVRATASAPGTVALVVGGGSGHYPAFAGMVGTGLAMGSACGNMFASPAVGQIVRVATASHRGGGVLLSYGNYAGDVLHFGQAQDRLNAAGIETRTVRVTDDIASGSVDEIGKRRGIAGDLTVFKVAGAAAEAGADLDEVERLANLANDRTRSLGVAFAGCTLPGATEPLFTVPAGRMAVGLGIHGEPGIGEQDMPTASELATLLVDALLADRPTGSGTRVVPILNGLGTVKYDELFVLFGRVAAMLEMAGLEVVEPECGELVTSLDMSGVSLTLFWLTDELERLWAAPADAPGFRKGSVLPSTPAADVADSSDPLAAAPAAPPTPAATPASVRLATVASALIVAVQDTIEKNAVALGDLDAIAGDGDHGIGMSRGVQGAATSALDGQDSSGVRELLAAAADAWSERAGGTSGALWAAAITAIGESLGNRDGYTVTDLPGAARAASTAITTLGKATLGDKTMVDAMLPYVDALEAAVAAGHGVTESLTIAAAVATDAANATAQLRPKLGRARPLAEKSLGHPDAGAVSFAMIVTRLATESTSPHHQQEASA